ncbi:hypothetical protein M5X17_24920, partial [Paenibacillus alvei]
FKEQSQSATNLSVTFFFSPLCQRRLLYLITSSIRSQQLFSTYFFKLFSFVVARLLAKQELEYTIGSLRIATPNSKLFVSLLVSSLFLLLLIELLIGNKYVDSLRGCPNDPSFV